MRTAVVALALLTGCAHAPPPVPVAAAATAPAPNPAPAATPAGSLRDQMQAAYRTATERLYARDYDGATRAFQAVIDRARRQGLPGDTEAWVHNALTWVRWGRQDHAGALAENEQVRTSLDDPRVDAEKKRGVLLHYWWDRAYLLLEGGDDAGADQARRTYEQLARQPDEHDGILVLAAWFAVRRHDGAAARRAAAQVDAAKDDDVQDLYVLALAREAGRDAAGAEAIRKQIRESPNEYPMKPLILQQMERDRQLMGGGAGHP